MISRAIITLATVLSFLPVPVIAGEDHTLLVKGKKGAPWLSQEITLSAGDTAELKFATNNPASNNPASPLYVNITIGGDPIQTPTYQPEADLANGESYTLAPVKVAGPAVISVRLSGEFNIGLATFDVNRPGVAGEPVAVPLESGTQWDVILESSMDNVNWTPTAPGTYPSASPQRFFRTRLVKRP